MPIGADELILNGLWSHSSTIYFEADNRLKQPSYDVINASLEYRFSPRFGVAVWGNNIADKHYYYTGVAGTTGDHGELAAPRMYGADFKFDF